LMVDFKSFNISYPLLVLRLTGSSTPYDHAI
jgi:hypothetical protein